MAVNYGSDMFAYVPEKHRTNALYQIAVSNMDPRADGFEVSGKFFNQIHANTEFVELVNGNVLAPEFDHSEGVEFIDRSTIKEKINKNSAIRCMRSVKIPDNVSVKVEPNGYFTASSLILGDLEPIP